METVLAALALFIVATVAIFALLRLMRRSSSHIVRGTIAATIVIGIVLSGVYFDVVLNLFNRTDGAGRLFIDPSWMVTLTPALLGWLVAWLLNRRSKLRGAH